MALDADDLKKIQELLAAGIAPLAAKVAPDEIGKVVAAHVAEAKKGLVTAEELAKREADAKAAAEKAEADRKAAEEAAKNKPNGKPAEKSPELVALEAQIAELTKRNEAAEAAAKAEREKARTTALYSATRAALTKKGIPEDKVDLALDVLKARNVLAYDGDSPGWKGKNDVGLDAVLPLESAADVWLKGEGKHFLPPVGAQGTGEGGGNRSGAGGSSGTSSLAELRASAGSTVLRAMNNLG